MMIQPAYDELKRALSTPEGEKAYLAWIGHPVTAMFLAAGRELARPKRPLNPDDSLLAFGESLGANNILDFMISPVGLAVDRMRGVMPVARYGVPANPDNKGDE